MHDYVKKLRQNLGLETWKWRQIVTSQTANTKYKWPPYDLEPTPPSWKFSAYATEWNNSNMTKDLFGIGFDTLFSESTKS